MEKVAPLPEYRELYESIREELASLGLNFSLL